LRTTPTPTCRGDADGAASLLVDLAAGIGGVVAAYRHQHADVEFVEDAQDVAHQVVGLRWIGPRGAQIGTAAQGELLDEVDREGNVLLGVSFDEPLETIAEADHLVTLLDGFDGHGTDDAVDSRSRAATDEQTEPARFLAEHVQPSKSCLRAKAISLRL
jgi:hypothetical protein